ncbi:MAG TPA: hypothetical protein VJA40_03875 [archaeon]|nr:hypothetical protein [archaeon]
MRKKKPSGVVRGKLLKTPSCTVCGSFDSEQWHWFFYVPVHVEGTGEWKRLKDSHVFCKHSKGKCEPISVVKWTGKNKYFEYWECDDCFNEVEKN